ncbi:MAG: hypothetical protein JXQ89_18195 [Pelagimonas sp.]
MTTLSKLLSVSMFATSLMAHPVVALDGHTEVYTKLGDCHVRASVFGNQSADVTLQAPGDPTSGGSLFINGKATGFRAITVADLEGCGFSQVNNLQQHGATGSFAADDNIGFQFSGIYGGVPVSFHAALIGASNTGAKFTYAYFGSPSENFGSSRTD